MLNLLQTWLAKIPHLLYFLGVAFVGGLATYLAEVPASSLLTAFSTQEGATALLKGALIAGLLAVVSVLKPATKGEIKSVNEVRAAAKITVPPVLGVMLFVVLLSSFMVGCIADAPIVPVTAANQNQIASCQSDALEHNGFMLGGLVVGAGGTGLASIGALESNNPGLQTALAVSAAIAAGLTTVAGGGAALTASAFTNSNCSGVVGALPAQAGHAASIPFPDGVALRPGGGL